MNFPELLFSVERFKRVVRVVKDLLRGQPAASMPEEFPALAEDPFAALKAEVDKAKTAFDKNPNDAGLEMRLAMASATYRDARYACAGRTQLGRLAINNRIRGGFEIAKVVKDHNIQ